MMYRILFLFLVYTSFSFQNYLSAQEQEYKTIKIDEIEEDVDTSSNDNQAQKSKVKVSKEDKKWDWSQFRVGGNLGLNFGSYTYIETSPTVGYWIMPEKLQIGVVSMFIYQNIPYDNYNDYKSFVYGGGIFLDYVIWRGLFAHGEFQLINKDSYFSNKRVNVPSLLLGAGYLQPIGESSHYFISVLYDILDTDESLIIGTFSDNFPLVIKAGFAFGFPSKK